MNCLAGAGEAILSIGSREPSTTIIGLRCSHGYLTRREVYCNSVILTFLPARLM